MTCRNCSALCGTLNEKFRWVEHVAKFTALASCSMRIFGRSIETIKNVISYKSCLKHRDIQNCRHSAVPAGWKSFLKLIGDITYHTALYEAL